MSTELQGKKIAILATDGVEGIELTSPREALEAAGATVRLLAPRGDSIQAWDHDKKSDVLEVQGRVAEADPQEYDALVLPGGVRNADALRVDEEAVRFSKAFVERGSPIGVICHGSWTLIETGLIRGCSLTSYPTLRTDLENAGAHWVDEEVRIDGSLVSSRRPGDLPAFNAALVKEFAKSRGQGSTAHPRRESL
jgi:protease I